MNLGLLMSKAAQDETSHKRAIEEIDVVVSSNAKHGRKAKEILARVFLADAYRRAGRLPEAIEGYQHTLTMYEAMTTTKKDFVDQNEVAYVKTRLGRALFLQQEALDAMMRNRTGGLKGKEKQSRENIYAVVTLFEEALEMNKKIFGETHRATVLTLKELGSLYFVVENYSEAARCFASAERSLFSSSEDAGYVGPDAQQSMLSQAEMSVQIMLSQDLHRQRVACEQKLREEASLHGL